MGDSPGKRGDKKEFWQSDSEEEKEPQDDLSDLYPGDLCDWYLRCFGEI